MTEHDDDGLADMLRKLAARDTGVRSNDKQLTRWKANQRRAMLSQMAQAGHLFKAQVSGSVVLYFTTAGAASDCARRAKAYHPTQPTPAKEVPPDWKDMPADESRAKRTICPPHRDRFQSFEHKGVHGGLQRGRVVRDDVEETASA